MIIVQTVLIAISADREMNGNYETEEYQNIASKQRTFWIMKETNIFIFLEANVTLLKILGEKDKKVIVNSKEDINL